MPSIDEQTVVVAQIEKQKAIIEGADLVLSNFEIEDKFFQFDKKDELGVICDVRDGTHDSPQQFDEGIPFITSKNLNNGNLDLSKITYISKEDYELIAKRSKVDNGDILFGMIGTLGNPVLVNVDFVFAIKNVALIKFYDPSIIERKYLYYYLMSNIVKNYFENESKGGIQKYIPLGFIRAMKIPLPEINVQKKIIAEIDSKIKIIQGVQFIKSDAQKKINQILADVWGVEYVEPVKVEVEDEQEN